MKLSQSTSKLSHSESNANAVVKKLENQGYEPTGQAPAVIPPQGAGNGPEGIQSTEKKQATFGQCLADKMAAKVGSWPFLIGQTAVLVGWIGANTIPGIPHWDQAPFILLNLMFSFASAYTAPIVLMSQNRQSDEDRENAAENHSVNLQTAFKLELLHQKIDALSTVKLEELIQLAQQQQDAISSLAVASNQNVSAAARTHIPAAPLAINTMVKPQTLGMFFLNTSDQQTFQSCLNLDNLHVKSSLRYTAQTSTHGSADS